MMRWPLQGAAGARAQAHAPASLPLHTAVAPSYAADMNASPTLSLAAVLAVVSAGCLSTSHVIPKNELMRIAQSDPNQRGERVRVVQGFAGEEEPPQRTPVTSSTTVVVVGGVGGGGAPARRSTRVAASRGGVRSSRGDLASAKASEAYWWIVAGAALGVGLAVTEGARYNGWVQLHPMHPVHLFGRYGEYTWMPLAQLDPETAAWAEKAIVRPEEGPWRRLERAPLDRHGLTYSILLGAAELPSATGSEHTGFLSHIQFGVFPTQVIGLNLDIALGWAENDQLETIFDTRWSLELQAYPLQAGRFHVGGYGALGLAARFEDGPDGVDQRDTVLSGGLLMQLDLTTTLALTGRVGVASLFDEISTEGTIGISVY